MRLLSKNEKNYERRKNNIIYDANQCGFITYSKLNSNSFISRLDEEASLDFWDAIKENGIRVIDEYSVSYKDIMDKPLFTNLKTDFFDYIEELNELIFLKTNRKLELEDYYDLNYIYDNFYVTKYNKDKIIEKVLEEENNTASNAANYRKYKNQLVYNSLSLLNEKFLKKWEKEDFTQDFVDGINVLDINLYRREIKNTIDNFKLFVEDLILELKDFINFRLNKYEIDYFVLTNLDYIFNLYIDGKKDLINICLIELNYIILHYKWGKYYKKIDSFSKYLCNVIDYVLGCVNSESLYMNEQWDAIAAIIFDRWEELENMFRENKMSYTQAGEFIKKEMISNGI